MPRKSRKFQWDESKLKCLRAHIAVEIATYGTVDFGYVGYHVGVSKGCARRKAEELGIEFTERPKEKTVQFMDSQTSMACKGEWKHKNGKKLHFEDMPA
jgi:hypothetical protein